MKRLSLGVRILLGFVTFLLCVALFVAAFAGVIASSAVHVLSSQENLESLLRQVMFMDMQHPATARHLPSGNAPALRHETVRVLAPSDIRLSEQQTATSLVEFIYAELAVDFGDQLTVDLETVKEFVERSTLDDFLVEKGAILIHDAYTGEHTITLSAEEIKAKIEENAALIEEYFQVPVDSQVIADVTSVIEENEYVERIEEEGIVNIILNPTGSTPSDPMENPNSADTDQLQQTVDTVRSLLSAQTLIFVIGICVLLIIFIMLVNIKQIWAGLNAIGITLMVAALPAVILTVAVWVIPAGWAQLLSLPAFTETVANAILSLNAVIYFGVFAAGLVLLICGIIVKCIARRKQENADVTAEMEGALIAEEPLPEVEFPTEEEISQEEMDVEETEDEEESEDDADEEEAEEEAEEEPEEEPV